jgi:two-component system sensor histidine kinase KdpD
VADHLSAGFERQALTTRMLDARMTSESQRLKSDLLAAVSHDLRTPLSTIQLTLQSLRRFDREHDAATRDTLLAAAEAETCRLSGLVGNLLNMSRLSVEAVSAELRPTRLADLVVDALDQARSALENREIIDGCADIGLSVVADPALARTALANVLENAARYAPDGPIEIRASEADGRVRLDVLDRGPGFPPDAEAMFARFTRGVTGDGRPPGTGLGLAVTRGFMEAQGGGAEASTRFDGRGARVRLTFRLATESPA